MSELTLLVVGGGGREHAMTWSLAKSSKVGKIYVAPGNAGTSAIAENVAIPADSIDELVQFVQKHKIDLVVVGPEVPLALGLVDALNEIGVRAFGPTQAGAQIEASKAFSKAFMRDHNIPTAEYASFEDYESAVAYVKAQNSPLVVKADGLAAGKGVIICESPDEALKALQDMMVDNSFSGAGNTVVIEEFMTGPEVSVLAFTDGKTVVTMPPARDHKRAYDNDEGPNTGGMGAFTPPPDVSPELIDEIAKTVLQPAVDGMAKQGIPYVGVLYAGLMLTENGIRNLEFNCRFGDPETQVILPLLETDLIGIMQACIDGTLDALDVQWKSGACATVVAASGGYPAKYPKGLAIDGLDDVTDQIVFHAGTASNDNDDIVTSGGRVLAVSAIGDDLDSALDNAYDGLRKISFEGMHYRTDIGRVR